MGTAAAVPPPSLSRRHRASIALRRSVLARFASVGVVNTLVDLVLYVVLSSLGVGLVLANFLSTSAGMAVSFVGNRRFVFGGTSNRRREIALFVIVCGLGIWVIQPAVIISAGWALDNSPSLPLLFENAVPKIAAILVAAVWNYVLYSKVVFRRAPAQHSEAASEPV